MRHFPPSLALAALLLTVAGCSSGSSPGTFGRSGISSTPTTLTETATGNSVVNGRILSESMYLARARRACDGCDVPDRAPLQAFDTATGRVLLWWEKGSRAFVLVGPDGERTRVTCGDAFACPRPQYGVDASIVPGPGPDEFSVWSPGWPDYDGRATDDQKVQVIGFDGEIRRTIDLADRLPRAARVAYLAWSPDGTQLAVTTKPAQSQARAGADAPPSRPRGRFNRIWLIQGEGDPQLVHTASRYSGRVPKRAGTSDMLGHLSRPSWSPDGSRLAFAEFYGPTSRSGELTWYSFATRIFSLELSETGQDGPFTPTMLHEYRGYPGGANKDVVWSPDGTRLGFRKWRRVFEVSAEDGRVLARSVIAGDGLVWPAKQP